MLFNAKFIALASLFAVVAAQQPPACVLQCSQAALPSATNKTCTSFADPCVCTDMGFQAADSACLKANCSPADQAAADQLNQSFCGGSSNTTAAPSGTGSATMTGSMTASGNMSSTGTVKSVPNESGSATGSSSGSAASASKSPSAAAPQAEFGIFALGVAAAGAVVGGLLI